MKFDSKNIFLFDGMGAILTALTVGLVLPLFSERLGLPAWLLYSLAVFALMLSAYSLGCYKFVNQAKPLLLTAIISANLCYCLTVAIIALGFNGVTLLGRAYFFGENILIIGVVLIEVAVYRRAFGTRR